jgi:hypothetical protein
MTTSSNDSEANRCNVNPNDIGMTLVNILFVSCGVSDYLNGAPFSALGWWWLAGACLGMWAVAQFASEVNRKPLEFICLVLAIAGVGFVLGAPSTHHHVKAAKAAAESPIINKT